MNHNDRRQRRVAFFAGLSLAVMLSVVFIVLAIVTVTYVPFTWWNFTLFVVPWMGLVVVMVDILTEIFDIDIE